MTRRRPVATLRSPVAEEFARRAIEIHNLTPADTVEKVLGFALNAVGCDHAAIMPRHPDLRLQTAAATSELVATLDQVRTRLGERPEVTVLDDSLGLVVHDTQTEARWPVWARQVAASGISSVLCIPMYTGDETLGTLSLYSEQPDAFDADDLAVAHLLAIHAADALATARKIENLWHAAEIRKLVGQAQGILMERFDLTADRAFGVLLRYCHERNLKLRVVADRLVHRRTTGPDADQ